MNPTNYDFGDTDVTESYADHMGMRYADELAPSERAALHRKYTGRKAAAQARLVQRRSQLPPHEAFARVHAALTKHGELSRSKLAGKTLLFGPSLDAALAHGMEAGHLDMEERSGRADGSGPRGQFWRVRTAPEQMARYGRVDYMTDEDAFHVHLDAHSDDHTARMVFADYLDEQGDPRGPGYRALGMLGVRPWDQNLGGNYSDAPAYTSQNNRQVANGDPQYVPHALPEDWFKQITGMSYGYGPAWTVHASRKDAEDTAAHAFSQLPPERQVELLNPPQPEQMARYAEPQYPFPAVGSAATARYGDCGPAVYFAAQKALASGYTNFKIVDGMVGVSGLPAPVPHTWIEHPGGIHDPTAGQFGNAEIKYSPPGEYRDVFTPAKWMRNLEEGFGGEIPPPAQMARYADDQSADLPPTDPMYGPPPNASSLPQSHLFGPDAQPSQPSQPRSHNPTSPPPTAHNANVAQHVANLRDIAKNNHTFRPHMENYLGALPLPEYSATVRAFGADPRGGVDPHQDVYEQLLMEAMGDNPQPANPHDNHPLKTALATHDVMHEDRLAHSGQNKSSLLTTSSGHAGVFKPKNGEKWLRGSIRPGTYYRRESAASAVADLMGLHDLVPATTIREHNGEIGSIQEYKNGRAANKVSDSLAFDGPEDRARAALFDYVIGNTDRHQGNWLVSPEGKLVLIDNGLAFPHDRESSDNYHATELLRHASFHQAPTPDWTHLAGKWPEIEQSLVAHGIEPEAIELTKERFDHATSGQHPHISNLPDWVSGMPTIRHVL